MRLTEGHERLLIAFVALHSAIVGLLLILAPGLAAQLGGWERIDPAFFGRQAGAFHIVLAAGYLMEFSRYRGVRLIVIAKSFAFVFLLAYTVLDPLPWAVPVTGVIDGLMALVVWWVNRQVKPPPSTEA
ncbi:MAG: hypothetical protein C3F15_01090 [Holophagae bacterium]|nr:MAG: hypothetical protein C3F15_01090 [Holophagae bacterium]